MTEADQIVRNVKKELANRGRPHMTVPITNAGSRSLAARSAGVCLSFPPKRGGECRVRCPPRPRCTIIEIMHTRKKQVNPKPPGIPHPKVLKAYVVLSPVTGLFCHRRLADMFCLSPVGPTQLRELDASVGASGPHDFAVRCNISRQHAGDRSQVFRPALRSHRAQDAAASTASAPRVRDDRDTPLWWGGMARICRDDLPDG